MYQDRAEVRVENREKGREGHSDNTRNYAVATMKGVNVD